jgi:glycosyltransferase involved in cell wall biosynthesis
MFAKPWRTVWSGYDAQSMQDAVPVRSSSRFTLAYVGNASTQHDVAAFARTLAAWLGNKGEPECEFHYFGYESPTLIQALRAAGVSHILQQHEFIPREEAFARMKGADVLVLMPLSIHGRSRIAVGVKELEYLASGTPVLVIGRLLPELRRHFGDTPQVMEAADSEAGVNFLRQEYDAFRAGRSSNRRRPPNDEVALSFSWTAQVRVLADVLSRAAEKRPRNAAR